ncbi:MAG: transcription-repair coupling factor, partial [Oscillospiraceae bacterium]|nr:transcription-repair coupling factor [Oscillospiraceae bacterium]
MEFFLKAAEQNTEYNRLCKYIDEHNPLPALVTGLSHIHKSHFIAALLSKAELLPVLVIAESEGEAQKLCLDINTMSGEEKALLYPAKEMALGNYEAASREYEHKRIFALNAMLSGKCSAVICSPEAAGQLTIPPDELEKRNISLEEGQDIPQDELVQRFLSAGYSRADLIEGAGQFSVRGGIIDVFPPSSSTPYRIELWGDTIDSIAEFDLDTQRRTESHDSVCISPA